MPLTLNMLQSLLNRNTSAADAKELLLQTAEEHPYFTAAHFFLLQNSNPTHPDYEKLVAKTTILFNNPFWLNLQLKEFTNQPNTSTKSIAPHTEEVIEQIVEPVLPEETVIEEQVLEIVEEEKQIEPTEAQTVDSIIDSIPVEDITTEEKIIEEEIAPIKIDLKLSDINPTEDTISFEPLHTTDYFASQGIKLSEEVAPTDKLGKQLKSFTEWLKVMKKVHTEDAIEPNPGNDTAIQTLAEKSNTEDAIVTEAMAEVLLQQGKTGKAREVYQKLSLLNPSKSAYFAAKIEQLKG
ncbi:hypothetical protein LK994_09650 [Ferruginibacter lapsinanis]|uniref:hypothetical protein n=1 Tax=Ferruginibacter lapsinanis TaxID=563172 RepID=UPI001E4E0014|nr:hypothetical protein [Ferruginibacter lapsinanis]UEG48901.1 hypothetical protein LK994_09650 [Ferruginibacter lapsinanis]